MFSNKLPLELRLIIWSFALPEPRVIVLGYKKRDSATDKCLRSLHAACRESRSFCQERYKYIYQPSCEGFYANLNEDTFYLPSPHETNFWNEFITMNAFPIQRLAIDYAWFDEPKSYLSMTTVQELPTLKHLKIIVDEPGSTCTRLYSETYLEDLSLYPYAAKDPAWAAAKRLRRLFRGFSYKLSYIHRIETPPIKIKREVGRGFWFVTVAKYISRKLTNNTFSDWHYYKRKVRHDFFQPNYMSFECPAHCTKVSNIITHKFLRRLDTIAQSGSPFAIFAGNTENSASDISLGAPLLIRRGPKMTTIRLPTGFNMTDYLGSGITSMVYLDPSSNTVVKYPHQVEEEPAIEVERRIYERFQQHGGHEGLLHYHGTFESGIRLEYASKNGLRQYIQTHEIDTKQRLQWAQQVTSALAFVHSMNVVHADLTCGNITLDDSLHAKLLDFSGSSLDGSDPAVVVTASHKCPEDDLKSTRADLFALGSTLYEILTGKPPYYGLGLKEIEITSLFKQSKFPETKSLGPIGDIITGCWQGRFVSANDVLEAINSGGRTCSFAPPTLETTIVVSVLGLLRFLAHRLTRR